MLIRVNHKLYASFFKQSFVHPTLKAEQGANMTMLLRVKMMRKHDVEGRLVLTMKVMLMTIMLMTRVSMMMMMMTTTLRGGGWCCPGDKCSSPQPDTLHFSPPRPPLPSVLFSKLFLVFVGVTVKVEILHWGQSDPSLQKKLQNNHFHSRPIHGANISEIFHSLEPQNQIIFNLSLIFETHTSTRLLTVSLTPQLLLPQFN